MKSMEICKNLRWKSASRDSDEIAVIMTVFMRNQVPYSCLRTCQAWGPDGDAAAPELCDRERGCFVARRVEG